MPLYRSGDATLSLLREEPFKLERDMQTLVERNMETLLELELVSSEFSVGSFRIDSLVFDRATNAFVIVEYKRDKNFSVVDQGYAYLSTMLNNKADFILEYNETKEKTLQRSEIDWSQSRVVFVAPSFTTYQQQAINLQDMPIELWELKRYQGGFVGFSKVKSNGSRESIQTLTKEETNSPIKEVNKEVKVFTEAQHLEGKPQKVLELYARLRDYVLSLNEVELKPTKLYIGFRNARNFADVLPQNSALKIWLNVPVGMLEDPLELARDVSNVGHWGNGDYELKLSGDKHFSYVCDLIEQAYTYQVRAG